MYSKKLKLNSEFSPSYLARFLAGEPRAYATFPGLVHNELMGMAKALAPDLPPDLHGEVVNETWRLLLEHRTPLNIAIGSVRAYFRMEMRNAIKVVRAANAAVGRPKRNREPQVQTMVEVTARPSESEALVDVELTPDSAVAAQMEAAVQVRQVLGRAPPHVARALRLVHVEGRTLTEAAEIIGTSRFTLARQLERFERECRDEKQAALAALG